MSNFNSLFVHTKYTSNMAARFSALFNDVTAPHAFDSNHMHMHIDIKIEEKLEK